MEWIFYLVLGLSAGFISGLLGIGGGSIMVPALYFLFKYYLHLPQTIVMHMALGTSLAAVLVNVSISSVTHAKNENLLWMIFYKLLPGLILGAITAVLVINFISGDVLHILFIIFLTLSAVESALNIKPQRNSSTIDLSKSSLFGFLISFFSSLLGIGGSILSIPYFLWSQIEMKKSVALAAACAVPISFIATLGYIFAGFHHQLLPNLSLGYVFMPCVITMTLGAIWGSPIGAIAALKLPNEVLQTMFFFFLLSVATSMLVDYFV